MKPWRFSYGGNEGARNNAEGAIKNNAEDAIKTAAHNRTPVAAGARIRVLQGSGRKAKRAGQHLRWLLFRRLPLLHAGRAAMVAFNGARYSHIRILEGDAVNR